MATRTMTGRLLVATPLLEEPTFRRAVVLLIDHNDEGALGVVINRAATLPVREVLGSWSELVSEPGVLFAGGPVAQDSALGIAEMAGVPNADGPGWRACFGRTGLIDLDAPTQLWDGAITQMRIFAGYAGWGAGQLEAEITEGSWYVVDPRPGDVFGPHPDDLWRRVLRRQADTLAYVSTFPDDPSLN